MKKNINKINVSDLKVSSFDELLKKELRSKPFHDGYYKELARLEVVRQIRDLRRSERLTQKAFAEKVGMPQSVIARLETGKHNISLSTLLEIAASFGKKVALI